MIKSFFQPYLAQESFRVRLKSILGKVGFDTTDWLRVVMYGRCFEFIRGIQPETLNVLEISGGPQWRRTFNFGSYTSTQFPDFDICSERPIAEFILLLPIKFFSN